jgi:hypothetical protein
MLKVDKQPVVAGSAAQLCRSRRRQVEEQPEQRFAAKDTAAKSIG